MIEIYLPENISEYDKRYFFGKEKYRIDQLKVNRKKNVFISHEGLVYKNLRLVSNSMFNIKGNLDSTFYFEFWKLVTEQFFVSTYGRSLKKINLTKSEYIHIYTKWFGYFFWITDSLPKLIKTSSEHKNIKLIYPERWLKNRFINESLKMFPNIDKEVVEKDTHLQVKYLLLPETRQWSNAIDPKEIKLIKEFVFNYINNNPSVIKKRLEYENIYISREKAKRRKISNQKKVDELLRKFNFKKVCFEDYNFFEQVEIVKNAKNIIGVHGAGLVNLVFKKNFGNVLELSPKPKKSFEMRIPFWRISNCIKNKYFIQFCDVDKLVNNEVYDSNINVDIKELENNINLMTN